MIDLEQLEADREKATIDKADLFDFYHKNWNAVIAELRSLRAPEATLPEGWFGRTGQ
jgi:hypothetical protein